MSFKAKFDSDCPVCGQRITVGSPAVMAMVATRKKAVHAACADAQSSGSGQAAVRDFSNMTPAEFSPNPPPEPPFNPTAEQSAIFHRLYTASQTDVPFQVFLVDAVAGSGKTTVIRQAALFNHAERYTVVLTFNTKNAKIAQERLPHSYCKTYNAFTRQVWLDNGNKIRSAQYGGEPGEKDENIWKFEIMRLGKVKYDKAEYGIKMRAFGLIKQLVDLAKDLLLTPAQLRECWATLASKYDIELNNITEKEPNFVDLMIRFFEATIEEVDNADALGKAPRLSYADQGYFPWFFECDYALPVLKALPEVGIRKLVYISGDEIQDVNPSRLFCLSQMIRDLNAHGIRVILCGVGDKFQAINGFCGSMTNSIEVFQQEFSAAVLPLHQSFRTQNRAIVEWAQTIVPHFSSAVVREDAYEPIIEAWVFDPEEDRFYDLLRKYKINKVLSRVNGVLVALALGALTRGIKATVLGRDIGRQLAGVTRDLAADTQNIDVFVQKVEAWRDLQYKVLNGGSNVKKIIWVEDTAMCLLAFAEKADSVAALLTRITALFSDDDTDEGIVFSSIHKAKGLEAENCLLIDKVEGKTMFPHYRVKLEEFVKQEWNLLYVAITRAMRRLVVAQIMTAK